MRFKNLVGLEWEVFALNGYKTIPKLGSEIDRINNDEGSIILSGEFGARMIELITPPLYEVTDLIKSLRTTLGYLPEDWDLYFVSRDPCDDNGEVEWVKTPRYEAIVNAVEQEKPDSWQGVFQFAKWCSLHVNIGIDPWSPLGLLIMNTINNVAPYIGYMTREDFPESRGHMAIWRGWTDQGRLPSFGRMFNDFNEFSSWFRKTTKLIRQVGKGQYEPDLFNPRDPFNRDDLGTFWIYCRPKLSENNVWYIEIRVLPSIPLEKVEEYVTPLLLGINKIQEEFDPRHHRVTDIELATGWASKDSRLFPNKPLNEREWEYFLGE